MENRADEGPFPLFQFNFVVKMAARGSNAPAPKTAAEKLTQQLLDDMKKPENKTCADCDGRVRDGAALEGA